MDKLNEFMEQLFSCNGSEDCLANIKSVAAQYHVYPHSLNRYGDSFFFITKSDDTKVLVATGENKIYKELSGEERQIDRKKFKLCPMNNKNCHLLREIFHFMNPQSHKGTSFTIGLGDRLGLASSGHIRLLKDKDAFPVLAQQSIRELTLTGRNYDDVLCDACWAVFQEGYLKGFGADGDHLKTKEEVKMALEHGYTMITLDCSEYIGGRDGSIGRAKIDEEYNRIDSERRGLLESKYIGKTFKLKTGNLIEFSYESLKEASILYIRAIDFAVDVYKTIIANCGREIDFEMSVDETYTATTPEAHFFVASELISAGAKPVSLAPKFCGEFQKGIDYKGNVERFEREFAEHFGIAEHFDYKLSIHSGSDKFSIFPIIAKNTNGRVHLKTAGTNWLEALRVIAMTKPALLREIYAYGVKNLAEAKKYYHVSVVQSDAPDANVLSDDRIPDLLELAITRQILHITYGLVLHAKDDSGRLAYKDRIYSQLKENEDLYYEMLIKHIGRHVAPFEE